jgi:hypothetical protein
MSCNWPIAVFALRRLLGRESPRSAPRSTSHEYFWNRTFWNLYEQ